MNGKKGLIVGVANDKSIAWGCAKAFREAGAELAITYLNEKAEPFVRPLAEKLKASIILPLDVRNDDQMNYLFERISKEWGKLDFLFHAIAFAPKQDLDRRVVDCSKEGFSESMEISCYSFINLARLAEPLMKDGGCMLTTTYYGGEKVVEHYGIMGPVKAALEGTVKYLASDLGNKKIRVNAISPGPVATRAASGIAHFDKIMKESIQKSPGRENTTIECIGSYARFLVSEEAYLVTGSIVYVDAGFHIMAT